MKPHKGGRPTAADRLTLLQRRQRVAAAYLAGKSQWQIAEAEGVDQSTVSHDLAALRKEWLASALQDFDQRKALELAKIDALEATATEAWLRSCQDGETLQEEVTKGRATREGKPLPDLTRTRKTVRGQSGDPRFLERVAWCIQKRLEIHGVLRQEGQGVPTVVTVVAGIDLQVVTGEKPGLTHETLRQATPN